MKILMLSPNQATRWNPGHNQWREAVGKQHDVRYYGQGYKDFTIPGGLNHVPSILEFYRIARHWVPDVVMTYGYRYSTQFTGLREIKIPKVQIVCDFTRPIPNSPGTISYYYPWIKMQEFDVLFCMSYQVLRWFEKHDPKQKIFYVPFGVDEKIFKPKTYEKGPKYYAYVGWSKHDAIYPLRTPVEKMLREEYTTEEVLIKRSFGKAFIENINRALLNLNTSNVYRTMNMKTFEVMACASCLVTEKVQEIEDLGYRDMIHYIAYKDVGDLSEKMWAMKDVPNIIQDIANAGYRLTIKENTNKHRVEDMTRRLNEIL